MKTSIVTTRLFGENIYIIWDETTLEAAIIDPGMMDGTSVKRWKMWLSKRI